MPEKKSITPKSTTPSVILICDCVSQTLPTPELEHFFKSSLASISREEHWASAPSGDTQVLIVTNDPISAVAHLLDQGVCPENAIAQWSQWAQAFLKKQRQIRRQSTVVFLATLLKDDQAGVDAIGTRLGSSFNAPFAFEARDDDSLSIAKTLAAELLRQSPDILDLAEAIVSVAVGSFPLFVPSDAIATAWEEITARKKLVAEQDLLQQNVELHLGMLKEAKTATDTALAAKDRELEKLRTKITKLDLLQENVSLHLGMLKEAKTATDTALAAKDRDLEKLRTKIAKLDAAGKAERGETAKARASSADLNERLTGVQQEMRQVQDEWTAERKLLQANIRLHLGTLKEAKTATDTALAAKDRDLENLRTKITKLDAAGKAERGETAKARASSADLNERLTGVQQEMNQVQDEWTAERKLLQANIRLHLGTLKEAKTATDTALAAKDRELEKLRTKITKLDAAGKAERGETAKARASSADLNERLTGVQQEMNQVQDEWTAERKLLQANIRLHLGTLKEAKTATDTALAAKDRDLENLRTKITKLDAAGKAERGETAKARASSADLNERLAGVQQEMNQVQDEWTAERKLLQANIRLHLGTLKEAKAATDTALAAKDRELEKLRTKIAKLDAAGKAERGETAKARASSADLKERLAGVQQEMNQVQDEWTAERKLLRTNVRLHLDTEKHTRETNEKRRSRMQQEHNNLREEAEHYFRLAKEAQSEQSRLVENYVVTATSFASPTVISSLEDDWCREVEGYLKTVTGGAADVHVTVRTIADAFDSEAYLKRRKDVADAGISPILHYLTNGATEGYDPSPYFSSDWYLAQNQDVAQTGINPLVHYLLCGQKEQRQPRPGAAPGADVAIPVQDIPVLQDEIAHLNRSRNTLLEENAKLESRWQEEQCKRDASQRCN